MNTTPEPSAASRFDPGNEELRRSLAWHADITADLQRRILEARVHARGKSDYTLLAILDGGLA